MFIFFEAEVRSVDVVKHEVVVSHGSDQHTHSLEYDDVVFALGSVTNFYNPCIASSPSVFSVSPLKACVCPSFDGALYPLSVGEVAFKQWLGALQRDFNSALWALGISTVLVALMTAS